MRNEYELVLCSARAPHDDEARARLPELAAAAPDWDRVAEIAETEGVWADVSRTLLASEGVGVPQEFVTRWTIQHAHLKYLRGQQAAAAAALVDHLAARGLPALMLKGLVLEQLAYGEAGRRATSDIDLLVEERHFPEVERALFEAGYAYPGRRPEDTLAGEVVDTNPKRHIKSIHLYLFAERAYVDGDVTVDLHVLPLDRRFTFRLSFDDLYAQRQTVEVEGHELPTLGVHDTILYAAYRGLDSAWRLKYTRDVAGLVSRHAVDWDALFDRARRCGAQRVLAFMLGEVEQRLGLTPPEAVRARLDPAWWQAVAARYQKDRSMQEPAWYRLRRYLAFQDDGRAKARFLWFVGLHRGLYDPMRMIRRRLHALRSAWPAQERARA